ncbi:hypothetical protein RI367_004273 [Sorochytrium milnesiophthora]
MSAFYPSSSPPPPATVSPDDIPSELVSEFAQPSGPLSIPDFAAYTNGPQVFLAASLSYTALTAIGVLLFCRLRRHEMLRKRLPLLILLQAVGVYCKGIVTLIWAYPGFAFIENAPNSSLRDLAIYHIATPLYLVAILHRSMSLVNQYYVNLSRSTTDRQQLQLSFGERMLFRLWGDRRSGEVLCQKPRLHAVDLSEKALLRRLACWMAVSLVIYIIFNTQFREAKYALYRIPPYFWPVYLFYVVFLVIFVWCLVVIRNVQDNWHIKRELLMLLMVMSTSYGLYVGTQLWYGAGDAYWLFSVSFCAHAAVFCSCVLIQLISLYGPVLYVLCATRQQRQTRKIEKTMGSFQAMLDDEVLWGEFRQFVVKDLCIESILFVEEFSQVAKSAGLPTVNDTQNPKRTLLPEHVLQPVTQQNRALLSRRQLSSAHAIAPTPSSSSSPNPSAPKHNATDTAKPASPSSLTPELFEMFVAPASQYELNLNYSTRMAVQLQLDQGNQSPSILWPVYEEGQTDMDSGHKYTPSPSSARTSAARPDQVARFFSLQRLSRGSASRPRSVPVLPHNELLSSEKSPTTTTTTTTANHTSVNASSVPTLSRPIASRAIDHDEERSVGKVSFDDIRGSTVIRSARTYRPRLNSQHLAGVMLSYAAQNENHYDIAPDGEIVERDEGYVARLLRYIHDQDRIRFGRQFGLLSRMAVFSLMGSWLFAVVNVVGSVRFMLMFTGHCMPQMASMTKECTLLSGLFFVLVLGACKDVVKVVSLCIILYYKDVRSKVLTWHYSFLVHSVFLFPIVWLSIDLRTRLIQQKALARIFDPRVVVYDLFLSDAPLGIYSGYMYIKGRASTVTAWQELLLLVPFLLTALSLPFHLSRFFWQTLELIHLYKEEQRLDLNRKLAVDQYVNKLQRHVLLFGPKQFKEDLLEQIRQQSGLPTQSSPDEVAKDMALTQGLKFQYIMCVIAISTLQHLLGAMEPLQFTRDPKLAALEPEFKAMYSIHVKLIRSIEKKSPWTLTLTEDQARALTLLWKSAYMQKIFESLTETKPATGRFLEGAPFSIVQSLLEHVIGRKAIHVRASKGDLLCILDTSTNCLRGLLQTFKLIELAEYTVILVDVNTFDRFVTIQEKGLHVRTTSLREYVERFERCFVNAPASFTRRVIVAWVNVEQYEAWPAAYVSSIEQELLDAYPSLPKIAKKPMTPKCFQRYLEGKLAKLDPTTKKERGVLITDREGIAKAAARILAEMQSRVLMDRLGKVLLM